MFAAIFPFVLLGNSKEHTSILLGHENACENLIARLAWMLPLARLMVAIIHPLRWLFSLDPFCIAPSTIATLLLLRHATGSSDRPPSLDVNSSLNLVAVANAFLVLLATFHAYMLLLAAPVMFAAIQIHLLANARRALTVLTLDVCMLLAIRLLVLPPAVVTCVPHLPKIYVMIAQLIDVLAPTAAPVGLILTMTAIVFHAP